MGKDGLTPSGPGSMARNHFGCNLGADIDKRHHRVRKVIITNAAVAVTCTERAL